MARWWFLIVALLVSTAACQQEEAEEAGTTEETAAAVDPAAVEDHILATDDQFEQGMLAGDPETLVALYAPDAVVLPPGMPRAEGTDAIRSVWQQMFEAGRLTAVSLDTQTVVVSESGDMAYNVGTFSMTVTAADGSSVTETGKYLTIHKPTETGEWKIAVDTWNSDQAPGTPPAEETQPAPPAGQ